MAVVINVFFTFLLDQKSNKKNVFKKFLEELGFLFFEKITSPNKNKIIRMVPIFEESKTNYFFRVA